MNEEENQLEALDILNIASFIAQIQNMEQDNEHNKMIKGVIEAIATEIDKLHKENDIIMAQNEEIINMLKEKDNCNHLSNIK